METDLNKGITGIKYNSLNLPRAIEVAKNSINGRVKYLYSASGAKLRTIHETDHNIQTATIMAAAPFSSEITDVKTTDHLGNNRVMVNAAGEVTQSNHYYPFGTAFVEKFDDGKNQPYKYNGKELD